MKKFFFFLLVGILSSIMSYGQGIVRGKISDENGEPVVGATIVLKSNPGYGTITDFDGNYNLKINEETPQIIVISYISYQTVEETVNPAEGKVIVKNFILKTSSQELSQVEITAKASREKDAYMEKMKMNSATTMDYISSETIKKTGDSYVVAAVARVPGVTTTSRGFISVRGISDRYIKTTLNGSVIPTLDPFTNNIKLDIFPTSLIDNVMLSKTELPDLPGDWAGAYISVLTKDYPDQLSVNFETTIGYNNQSTFKDVLTSDKSSTDWLGFDNGYRDVDHNAFQQINANPTEYEELVALGLQEYYNSLGVTTSWLPGSNVGDTYFKLGLIQLGLLGPAQFNDPGAVAEAQNNYYNGPYQSMAFNALNTEGAKSAQSLPNNWDTYYETAPLDFSQSISVGNQIELLGRPFGFIAGLRYASSTRFDPESKENRAFATAEGDYGIQSSTTQAASVATNGWSGLVNLAYKFTKNNSLSLLFMPNFTGVNKVKDGYDNGFENVYELRLKKSHYYEERKQLIYQLKSENYIPSLDAKIELNASYTDGSSSAPDFKTLTYFKDGDRYVIDIKESDTHRYYRYLDENILDSRISFEMPFNEKPGLSRKLKIGGAYQHTDKTNDQYDYKVIYRGGGDVVIADNDVEAFFDPADFGFTTDSLGNTVINKYYEVFDNPANNTFGYSEVIGGFVMGDYQISRTLRIAGGLRVEKANIYTDVYEYDQLGYEANDPRRQFQGEIFTINPGSLNEWSFLPSANLVYKLNKNEETPFNLRLNYSKSVARPSIRELSDVVIYDNDEQDFVFGNSNLKMVEISNYDLRLEYYFKSRDNVSVSLFYKDFKNHIELIKTNQGYTWQNVDKSTVKGIEFEGRKQLFNNLELIANLTLVESSTEFIEYRLQVDDGVKNYIPVDTVERSMFGQAPFVINAILNYSLDSLGLNFSVSYNLQGRKLAITTTDGTPDIYEMPRNMVDLKVAKSFGKHFSASFKVRNILNEPTRRTYYGDSFREDYDRYQYGVTYSLGLSYKLN